ncbi:MAG: hypothetical protein IJ528_02240 [Bacteroidaceae bacterium]|nr:hypothetical protein [Bacteroidaceae bacterium]
MEELKVYNSLWKQSIIILVSIIFTSIGIYAIIHHPERNNMWAWLGTVLFGCGGILFLVIILNEHLSHRPYITVTDTTITVNHGYVIGRGWFMADIQLADISRFELQPLNILHRQSPRLIIHYKNSTTTEIPITYISMSSHRLCDVLNQRLATLK